MKAMIKDKIRPGFQYMLDGQTIVKVIRAVNQSNTIFAVQTSDSSILTVEAARLSRVDNSSTLLNVTT